MAHYNTVLSQMLKMIPRHEFEKLANDVDGKVRSSALSRWSQFVALSVGQLNGRQIRTSINYKSYYNKFTHHILLFQVALVKKTLVIQQSSFFNCITVNKLNLDKRIFIQITGPHKNLLNPTYPANFIFFECPQALYSSIRILGSALSIWTIHRNIGIGRTCVAIER